MIMPYSINTINEDVLQIYGCINGVALRTPRYGAGIFAVSINFFNNRNSLVNVKFNCRGSRIGERLEEFYNNEIA